MSYRLNIPSPPPGSLELIEEDEYRDEDVVEEDIVSPYGPSDSGGLEVFDDEDVETLASRPPPDPNRYRLAMNQTCLYLDIGSDRITTPHEGDVLSQPTLSQKDKAENSPNIGTSDHVSSSVLSALSSLPPTIEVNNGPLLTRSLSTYRHGPPANQKS